MCKNAFDFLNAAMDARPDPDEPMLRAWIQEWREPGVTIGDAPGRWVAERTWPSPDIKEQRFFLDRTGLAEASTGDSVALTHRSPQTIGLTAPEWLSMAIAGEAPVDQRADDGKSLVFDAAPLAARIEILGSSVVELDLSVDQPVATVAVRLNDVAPEGTSRRVVLGVLNLTHRDGHAEPSALEPGKRYRVRIVLPETGYAFAPGHRIRLALSTCYWPVIWPSPAPVTLTVHTGTSTLTLPVRPPNPADAAVRPARSA